MATRTWKSSLADAETRLRRAFGLTGPIGAELSDPLPLQPVIITADATRPGNNGFRGRWWWCRFGAGVGTQGGIKVLSPFGAVIERIIWSPSVANGNIQFNIATPDVADAFAFSGNQPHWAEYAATATDGPPIGFGQNVAAANGDAFFAIWGAVNTSLVIPIGVHLAPNAKMMWTGAGAGSNHQVTVIGYMS